MLGVFAGWMSEFAILFLIVVFAFFIYAKIQKMKLPLWFFIGFVGFFIGFLILYFNPGHSERASLLVFRTGNLLHGYFTIRELFAMPFLDFLERFQSLYTSSMRIIPTLAFFIAVGCSGVGSRRFLIISIVLIGVCFKLPVLILPLLILLCICCAVRCQNKLFFILAALFALHFFGSCHQHSNYAHSCARPHALANNPVGRILRGITNRLQLFYA